MVSGTSNSLQRRFHDHAAQLVTFAFRVTGDRALAEDLTQEAFIRLERASRPPAERAEAAYLRRVVINLAVDGARRSSRDDRLIHALATSGTVDEEPSAESTVAMEERDRRLRSAIAALPERQRDCVVLRFFGGLSERDIAAELGIAHGSVKSHLHRGRVALAEALEDLR